MTESTQHTRTWLRVQHVHFLKSPDSRKAQCYYLVTSSSLTWTSPVAQTVKRLPTMQGTRVQSLSREDLEKEMAIFSSILAWKVPWTEQPGRLQSMGSQELDTTQRLRLHFLLRPLSFIGGYNLYQNHHLFSFFFSFIFISWRLITLQHCSGFCHTLT